MLRRQWRSGRFWMQALLPAFCAILVPSCGDLPGQTFGTYAVTGTPDANSCGPGIGAPDPWQFDVVLSESGTTLYWRWMDESPLMSGQVTASGDATLTEYAVANVDTRDGGVQGPCNLQRNDRVDLVLARSTPPPSFRGSV